MTLLDHRAGDVSLIAKPLFEAACQLGEGLHWDAGTSRLWMTDIHGCRIWCGEVDQGNWRSVLVPQRVGWVIPCVGGDVLLAGLQEGFARLHGAMGGDAQDSLRIEWVARPFEGQGALRLNDAKADASGAVWAGSLNNDDESRSDGCLFRLGTDGSLTVVDAGYTVANGPAIHPEGRWMLHTDSGRRTIYAMDLDVAGGMVGGKQVWKVFAQDEGYPDGMTFDAEGCVWVAHWGAGCVSRFDSAGGLLARVALPALDVTNVCFGGPRLDRLFVSTARVGLSPERLATEPLAGSVFEVLGHGTSGLPGLRYGGG
jgi:D-xylonolactonase